MMSIDECPYCGEYLREDLLDEWYEKRDDGNTDSFFRLNCPHCRKEIEVEIEDTPTFYTFRVEEE